MAWSVRSANHLCFEGRISMIDYGSYEFNSAPLEVKLATTNLTIIDFVKWCIENKTTRMVGFREALIDMRFEKFSQIDMEFFRNAYFNIKGDADRTSDRALVLEALVLQCLQYDLKEFFLTVFKKERKYNMRLTAIRGYAAYATEAEIAPLMGKLASTLEKGSMTNCPYIEYERLRSKFGLPYLVERYGYDCFVKAMGLLDKLYDGLPDELKGYFMLDESGIQIKLLSDKEAHKRFDAFLEKERNKQH